MCTERALLALAVAMLSTGCLPGPLDELGRKCTLERACGIGLACVRGVCIREGASGGGGGGADANGFDAAVDAGPPPVADAGENLLMNPGFELFEDPDGKQRPSFWKLEGGGSVGLSEQMPYEGKRAAQITVDFTVAQYPTLTQEVIAPPAPAEKSVWCAEAWVRSTGALGIDSLASLAVSASNGAGSPSDSMTSRVKLGPTWQRVQVQYEPSGIGMGVQVRVSAEKLTGNTAMLVDSTRLYRAPKACGL